MKTERVEEVDRTLRPFIHGFPEKKNKTAFPSMVEAVVPSMNLKALSRDVFRGHIRQLMALLNRNVPLQAPIFSLLRILQNLPPDSRDAHLVMALLGKWEGLNSKELPLNVRKKMTFLEELFRQAGKEGQGEDKRLLFQEGPIPFEQKPAFSLKIHEKPSGKEKNAGRPALVLEMSLPRLGALEVFVTQSPLRPVCRISCRKGRTLALIRRALPDLKKTLSGRKGFVPGISVRQNPGLAGPSGSFDSSGLPDGKGLSLWG